MEKITLRWGSGKAWRIFFKILLLNSATTIFIFYLVLKKSDFEDLFDVFIMSLITGACCYTFTKIAIDFIEGKSDRRQIVSTASWMLAGALTGSFLSCLFFYFNQTQKSMGVVGAVFLYSFLFGSLFEISLFTYLNFRKKLKEAEQQIHDEKIKRLTLEKETALSTMKLMQAQIEPHFLFNTLSSIDSLLGIDQAKAKKMLMDLNEYLRIALHRTRQAMVTLDQELAFISRYLDILKVRMGNRLVYEIERKGDCSQILFPPMLIQPLVENAVKYGLEPKEEGGHISIVCHTSTNQLTISVSDTGLGIREIGDTQGIGLNNITRRLESIYGNQAMLIIRENKPSGVKAIIKVPL